MGATEISYLENTLYNALKTAGICTIANSVEPTIGNISEEKQSEMEDFLNTAKLMCETLGYFVFVGPAAQLDDDGMLFYKGARCKRVENGFLVLKGNVVSKSYKIYAPKGVKTTTDKAKIDENSTLLEDVFFSSSSYAASFVTGRSEKGLISWKNKNDVRLKELLGKN